MTLGELWQLSSVILLLAAFAVGFIWFERTRPSARIVAAVAALVAFGVIGRVVFAPFPNVKPTTDIVIIAGFALGFAPGWMVGVLTALVSNFYFTQGPWTPWQMLAWGACGLLGAALARGGLKVGSSALRRLPMALCCAAAGLLYAVIVNFGSAVNLASSDIGTSFWVQSVTSLPFDIAHVVANFAFFMLAGPLLVTMLERLNRRESIVWPAAPTAAPGAAVSELAHGSTAV
jgi:energy-coupling factor transport system substrate-specific component